MSPRRGALIVKNRPSSSCSSSITKPCPLQTKPKFVDMTPFKILCGLSVDSQKISIARDAPPVDEQTTSKFSPNFGAVKQAIQGVPGDGSQGYGRST